MNKRKILGSKQLKIVMSLFLIVVLISVSVPFAYGENESVIGTYTGTTTASWGYEPHCIFIINRIVDNKFRGQFIASNLGNYNINQTVEGNVYYGVKELSLSFDLSNYYNTSFNMTLFPYEGKCHCITDGSFHF